MEKILFASSNPRSNHLKHLQKELVSVRKCIVGHLDIIELSSVSYGILKKTIEQNKDITILHYSGHSDEDGFNVDIEGKIIQITKEAIANLVESCPNLRLVFLNGCNSEDIAHEIFKVNQNIPYVIGTENFVNDHLASVVGYVFYRNLVQNSDRTIDLAFNLTKDELDETDDTEFEDILMEINEEITDEGKKEISENRKTYRSLGAANSSGFWWHIHTNANISTEQKNWALIPKANLVLTKDENKDKIKILCLYEKEKEKYYHEIKSRIVISNDGELERVQNGLWEINKNSDKIDLDAFNAEYESADYILHLLSDTSYQDIIEQSGVINIIEKTKYSNKNQLFLHLTGIEDLFKNKAWFKKDEIIKHNAPPIFKNSLLEIFDAIKSFQPQITISLIFDNFLKQPFDLKLTKNTDPNTVKNALKNIPFFDIFDKYRETQNTKLFYTLLESTPNCAETLLINHVKKFKNISNNIQNLKITIRSNEKVIIGSAEDFWKSIFESLNIDDSLFGEEDYPKACIKTIQSKLKTHDFVIVFDGVSDDDLFNKEIIDNFWVSMKKTYPKFESDFIAKNPDKKVIGKLFVFVINNNLENHKLKKIEEKNTFSNEVSVSPISKFKEDDFNIWNELKTIPQPFSFSTFSEDGEPIYRRLVLKKLCEVSKCNFLIPKIDEEILKL